MSAGHWARVLMAWWAVASLARGADTIDIGSRLELFVDRHLVERFEGEAALHLHKPAGREVSLTVDKPWETPEWAYFAVSRDADRFRLLHAYLFSFQFQQP